MLRFIRKNRDQKGVTLVEYGLLVGLISIAAVAVIGDIGDRANALFTIVEGELAEATNSGASN